MSKSCNTKMISEVKMTDVARFKIHKVRASEARSYGNGNADRIKQVFNCDGHSKIIFIRH